MWIGHLYFFNFVNAQVAKTFDADSKKKVVPELMPRALYWFRWGAAYTWVTGILLLGLVYYMGGNLLEAGSGMSVAAGTAIGLAVLIAGFVVYDILWQSPLKNNPLAGAAVAVVLVAALSFWLGTIFSGRAVFIHIGALFGTVMAANVWMRIWPAQRKIIAAISRGEAPDAALPALAAMRSKHNTYMSVPLLFLMVSNHYPTVYGGGGWLLIVGFVIAGFLLTWLLYNKSGTAAPSKY
jgi:uncharacterized membrane protein